MKKLLLVDDSSVMRGILRRVLERSDLAIGDIVEASGGEEALERLEQNHDVVLVLTDVRMPGLDGVALVRAIRERHTQAELPVVVVASASSHGLAASALAHGANAFVEKPFGPEAIRDALGRWLE